MSHERSWLGTGRLMAVVVLLAQAAACGGGGGRSTTTGTGGAAAGGQGGGSVTGMAGAGGRGGPTPAISLIVDTPAVTVEEGKSAVFHVSLSQKSATPITVTVTAGDRTIATTQEDTLVFPANNLGPLLVTVLGSEDADLINNTTVVTLSSPDAVSASVRVQVTDNDLQRLIVTPAAVSMTEGNQTQLNVRLEFAPTAPTMVMVSSDKPGKLSAMSSTLTFNGSNYSIPQQVTLSALADGDTADDTVTVSLSPLAAGAFDAILVPISIVDKDVLNINVQPASLSLDEGTLAPGTLMISLTQAPPASLTVTVMSSADAKAGVDMPALAFTAANFAVPQAVLVQPKPDDDFKDETVTITFAAAGVTSRTASVTIKDDDSQAIMVNPATVLVNEGSSTTFTVRLAFNPGNQAVSVNAFSSNTSKVTVSPSTLMFDSSNFSLPQQLTVQGQQDDDLLDEMANVTLTSTGANSVSVGILVDDDDQQAIKLAYSTAPGVLVMQETQLGGQTSTTQIGVTLAYRPTAATVVTIASSDPTKLALSRPTLTFGPADYAVPQFITLTAPHDSDLSDDMINLHATGSGLPPADLPVQIIDLDVQNFVLSAIPDTMDEGTTAMFTIKLAFEAPDPVNVNVLSSNATGSSNVLTAVSAPAACKLKLAADTCTVTLASVADPTADDGMATITVADAAGVVKPRTSMVKIHDLNVQALLVMAASNPLVVAEDGSKTDTFTVKLGAQPPGAPGDAFAFTFTPSVVGAVSLTVATPPGGLTVGNATTGITVTVGGLQDDLLRDILLSLQISAPVGLGLGDKFLNITKTNDDTQGLILSNPPCGLNTPDVTGAGFNLPGTSTPSGGLTAALPLTIAEESTSDMLFCVRLAAQPDQATTVTLTPGQTPKAIAVTDKNFSLSTTANFMTAPGTFSPSPATLSFGTSNFKTSQPVWVHVPDDKNLDDDDGTLTISVTPFANPRIVYLHLPDNDRPQVAQMTLVGSPIVNDTVISLVERPSGMPVTNTATVQFALKNPPLKASPSDTSTSEVLTVSSSDCTTSRVSLGPSTLTFSDGNFDTPQTLVITAVADDDTVDEICHVTVSSNRAGTASRTLIVNIDDQDQLNLIFTDNVGVDLDPTTPTIHVDENMNSSFGIRFTANPAGAGHSAVNATLSIPTFTITPWTQMTFPGTVSLDTSPSWANVKQISFKAGSSTQCRASVVVPLVVSGWGGPAKTIFIDTNDAPICPVP